MEEAKVVCKSGLPSKTIQNTIKIYNVTNANDHCYDKPGGSQNRDVDDMFMTCL